MGQLRLHPSQPNAGLAREGLVQQQLHKARLLILAANAQTARTSSGSGSRAVIEDSPFRHTRGEPDRHIARRDAQAADRRLAERFSGSIAMRVALPHAIGQGNSGLRSCG